MSIFAIIFIAFLIGLAVGLITLLVWSSMDNFNDPKRGCVITCVVVICIWIVGIFIGIGIVTDEARIYIAQYEAQKYTIESSLISDSLTGLERAELVNQASTINGELAKRKATIKQWHYVTYDDSMYDSIEFIDIRGEKK